MIKKRLDKLRSKMDKLGINAFYIPGTDPHSSEYLPDFWKRREWMSGFSGSAGDLMVTRDKAGLWTDSRYFIQAESELEGSGIELFRLREPDTPDIFEWVIDTASEEVKLGIDPELISIDEYNCLLQMYRERGAEISLLESNPVDDLWEGRPGFPDSEVENYDLAFSGESRQSKLERVRHLLVKGEGLVITSMDDIAWLFNIRGSDVSYNPVVISYAFISRERAVLFTKKSKLNHSVQQILEKDISVEEYSDFRNYMHTLSDCISKIFADFSLASKWVYDSIPETIKTENRENPVALLKAVKNTTELQGMRNAHIRDGAALVKFLCWFSKNIDKGDMTECTVALKLEEFRSRQERFRGLSFETISAFKANGAIVHYTPEQKSCAEIKGSGLLLIDSGAQYDDGTTDITRTVMINRASSEEREMYTTVLKGHIDLCSTTFPEGTCGKQLDTIARLPLWKKMKNYGHGTGHGVGVFLNVHEAPPSISYYRCRGEALLPGMISSNEPGFYKEGEFGIRIENLIYVTEADSSETGFLCFKNLTMCPYERELIITDMLTEEQVCFIDNYHAEVRNNLLPLLDEEEKVWLNKATRPLCE